MSAEEEPLIDGKQLQAATGIPYTTLWRRAKANEIPHHWVPRHALDKRPRLMFRLSEVQAAIEARRGERGPGAG